MMALVTVQKIKGTIAICSNLRKMSPTICIATILGPAIKPTMAPAIIPANVLLERDILNFIFAPRFVEMFHCRYLRELFEIVANGKITSPSFTARKLRILW
jgi:hypothetical protein